MNLLVFCEDIFTQALAATHVLVRSEPLEHRATERAFSSKVERTGLEMREKFTE
jgi:hypothetical protein